MATTAPPSPNSKASGKANIREPTAASATIGASCQIRSRRCGRSSTSTSRRREHLVGLGTVGGHAALGRRRARRGSDASASGSGSAARRRCRARVPCAVSRGPASIATRPPNSDSTGRSKLDDGTAPERRDDGRSVPMPSRDQAVTGRSTNASASCGSSRAVRRSPAEPVHPRVAAEPGILAAREALGGAHGLGARLVLGALPGERGEHLLVAERARGRAPLAQPARLQRAHLVHEPGLPHPVDPARDALVELGARDVDADLDGVVDRRRGRGGWR